CGRPSSSRMKSSLVRLRTMSPFLSRTVASKFTTFTSAEKVFSCCARVRRPKREPSDKSAFRRETEEGMTLVKRDAERCLRVTERALFRRLQDGSSSPSHVASTQQFASTSMSRTLPARLRQPRRSYQKDLSTPRASSVKDSKAASNRRV